MILSPTACWVVLCADGLLCHERLVDGAPGGHYTEGGAEISARMLDARHPLCGPHQVAHIDDVEGEA